MYDSLSLEIETRVVRQVLVLGELVIAYEAHGSCLVGTHAQVEPDFRARLDPIEAAWRGVPGAVVRRNIG